MFIVVLYISINSMYDKNSWETRSHEVMQDSNIYSALVYSNIQQQSVETMLMLM